MAGISEIPSVFSSPLVKALKLRGAGRDSALAEPFLINLAGLQFKLARSFGFCYGVQKALEIAYAALSECRGCRIFLLSEIIHNPQVNSDLCARGVQFLYSAAGEELTAIESLSAADVVIIPAFGTTVEILERLTRRGIDPRRYDTTCPFVKGVWKASRQLGENGFAIIIHGQNKHEETRATFSEAQRFGPAVVVENLQEAELLAAYISGAADAGGFSGDFSGRFSAGFNPDRDLQHIGIVHQTTMLAGETEQIAALLSAALRSRYGEEWVRHWADTSTTLCYATQRNQQAVQGLIESGGELALVMGGYRSSNTSHLFELCRQQLPAYHIESAAELISRQEIRHFDPDAGAVRLSSNWLPGGLDLVRILVAAGASCPDIVVEAALYRVSSFFGVEQQLRDFAEQISGVE